MTTFDPIRTPYASTPGIGPLSGQTLNFNLSLTNFDWVAWHQYEWENWVVVDALLNDALYGVDVRGAWRPNTLYNISDIVIDTDIGSLLIAQSTHTSSNSLAADKAAGLWLDYSINEAFVQKGGDTMTGPLVLRSPTPTLTFDDEDVAQSWSWTQDGANMQLTESVSGAFMRMGPTDMVLSGMSSPAPVDGSVLTRIRGDVRFVRWRGVWVAGTYTVNDMVQDGDFLFIATAASTTEKPDNGTNPPSPADWDVISSGGGSTTSVGDAPPAQPLHGDLWFSTAEPVGLFVWYDDGDTQQWVQTNGSAIDTSSFITQAAGDARYLQLAGGSANAMTGIPWIASATPYIYFNETDQAAGGTARVTLLGTVSGVLTVATRADDGSAGSTIAVLNRDGGASNSQSIMLRAAADARYLQLSGVDYYPVVNCLALLLEAGGEGGHFILKETSSGKTGNFDMVAASNYMRIMHDMSGTMRQWYFEGDGTFRTTRLNVTGNATVGGTAHVAGGNLGVGTAPGGSYGIVAVPPVFNASNYGLVIRCKDASTNGLIVSGLGAVSLTTTYTDFTTASAANVMMASGGHLLRSTSSGEFKTDVEPLANSLDTIDALRPVSFASLHEADEGRRFTGFIAEEVAAALPEAMADEGQNYDVRAIVATLVSAVQALVLRIEQLEGAA